VHVVEERTDRQAGAVLGVDGRRWRSPRSGAVALGVLLDTLIVRWVLAAALNLDAGRHSGARAALRDKHIRGIC
jgi:hypothetical protein